MLHIAGGIILAVLFLRALPELLLGVGLLLRWLFIIVAWLMVWYAALAVYCNLPVLIYTVWFWFALAVIGTIVIVRKALNTPVYHHP